MRHFSLLFLLLVFVQCKDDKKSTAIEDAGLDAVFDTEIEVVQPEEFDKTLYAGLDRLKMRTDSSMHSGTVIIVDQGDTLSYLDAFSKKRENLRLRGKYYHEPWLKVRHAKSGKSGWVYAGAVRYDDAGLKSKIRSSSLMLMEADADDLEWGGTVPTGWGTAGINEVGQFKTFVIHFKEWVRNNEIDKIASVVNYPLKEIKTEREFKDNYLRLFSDDLKGALVHQRLDQIFRDSKGAAIADGKIIFRQIGKSYKIVNLDFKGRQDLTKELMQKVSGNYIGDTPSGKASIKAFTINKFLELTLNYQDGNGIPQSKSLGKYLFETSQSGKHSFYQDTRDSLRRSLVFERQDSTFLLEILKDPYFDGYRYRR